MAKIGDKNILGFSAGDVQRIQRAVRFVEDNATLFKTHRRIRGAVAGSGGTSLLKAYCKTDAGPGNTILCYLGYDEFNVRLWSPAVTYIITDKVTANGKFWYSLNATNLNNPPVEGELWTEIKAYDETFEYTSAGWWVLYDSKLWRSKQATTGDVPTEGEFWTTKASAYAAGTAYVVGDRVTYKKQTYDQGKLWRCIQAGTGHTPSCGVKWELVETKDYFSCQTYGADTLVTYNSKIWKSLLAANIGNTPVEGTWWTEITTVSAYAASTTYAANAYVLYNGQIWMSLSADNIGNTPAGSLYWAEIPEIEAHCEISCGTQLQFASPLLYEQFPIKVEYSTARARYEAASPFAAVEETCAEGGMLELVSEMVTEEQSNSTTALIEMNNTKHSLAFLAAANSTYRIDLSILYTGAAATTGIVLGVNGPTGKVSINGSFIGWDSGTIVGKAINCYYDESGGGLVATGTFTRTATGILLINGEFVFQTGATAGWFAIMFASEVAGSMVTIKSGSSIKYQRTHYELP